MRLSHGMQEIKLGWDLSLHAQPRRAITMNNIWLKEAGEGDIFGKNWNGQMNGQNSGSNSWSASWAKINPVLRFNLKGAIRKSGGLVSIMTKNHIVIWERFGN